jgi:hypothetical protein
MKLSMPFDGSYIVTQSYQEHLERAKANGWGYKPGMQAPYYYPGIDWATPSGTPIKAAADGTVKRAGTDASGYGNNVRLQHSDGYETVYAHLLSFSIEAGQSVRQGQVIGVSDNTGNSTGPHLHFELRKNNVPIDPAPLLSAAPVIPGTGTAPQPNPEPVLVEFPVLPKIRITAEPGINVRQAAGTNYPRTGYLISGVVVDVIRGVMDGSDVWLQIGHQQFIAMRYDGDVLAAWEA